MSGQARVPRVVLCGRRVVPPSRLGGQWGLWWSYRGDGLFETVGAEDGYPFLLEAHLARLASSARALYRQSPRLPKPPDVARLLERAGLARGAAVVRLLWYPGMEVVLGWAERARVPRKAREQGVELELATLASHPFSGHKLTSYGPRLLSQQKVGQAGAWGCLFVEPTGEVVEAATANVLFCFGNTVVTPPAPPALPGTVRAYCLAKLAAAGVETVVRPVRLSELQEASGAVLSASVSGLIPVRRIGSVRYARPAWLLEALLAGGFPAPGYRRRSTSTRATRRASNTTS